MIFDEQDTLSDFSTPLIHTFSKTTASIGEEWKQKLNERENVILMGKFRFLIRNNINYSAY